MTTDTEKGIVSMPEPIEVPTTGEAAPNAASVSSSVWRAIAIVGKLRALSTPGEPFGLPANAVRALMTFALVLTYLWMQWASPKPHEYVVPIALISAVGVVTGFYLTGEASPTMKALLSLLYVVTMAAFMLRDGWVPESVNTQVTTALGIYFGRKSINGGAPS